jgi:hypothetical protein
MVRILGEIGCYFRLDYDGAMYMMNNPYMSSRISDS